MISVAAAPTIRDGWDIHDEVRHDEFRKMVGRVCAGGERQARFLLLNYARGLEAKESPVRLATATGLSELHDVIAALSVAVWARIGNGAPRTVASRIIIVLFGIGCSNRKPRK